MSIIEKKLCEKLSKFCDEYDVSIFFCPKIEVVAAGLGVEDGEIFEECSKNESPETCEGSTVKQELNPKPDFETANFQSCQRPTRGLKRSADVMCHFFREGFCRKGSECKFSHDTASSRRYPTLCKFYENGYCNQKDRCPMLHGEYPCVDFHKGSCRADPCRFSHLPLTDYTREIVEKENLQRSLYGLNDVNSVPPPMSMFRPFKAAFIPHPVS